MEKYNASIVKLTCNLENEFEIIEEKWDTKVRQKWIIRKLTCQGSFQSITKVQIYFLELIFKYFSNAECKYFASLKMN